jgi:hypothetical protein
MFVPLRLSALILPAFWLIAAIAPQLAFGQSDPRLVETLTEKHPSSKLLATLRDSGAQAAQDTTRDTNIPRLGVKVRQVRGIGARVTSVANNGPAEGILEVDDWVLIVGYEDRSADYQIKAIGRIQDFTPLPDAVADAAEGPFELIFNRKGEVLYDAVELGP